ncbi:MAG: peptidoglycan-binding protein LysM [Candidatus Thiodiazotropha sp. (ex Lucina aurantia)]|uniref:LysM domain/BON superfamily protein n=2 Tax=Candidatus Thiodiazotropha TaxID=1913444 RepID=A0A7Z1AGM5_9GAMM|nr:peptidoglycan-binding protein LysM [Candidatus Thiodiazotropha endolucinida]MBT3013255.1 peptidoglycan-binding protein LysM [Candidatus Thiodiazotropha sp. (ex Lucina pensylvanica)]MBT3016571.1 peptidoglycan-binding protein LysM [Candidatus Thiodiazotropha taylori]MBT3040743.1 peptidoglycan-binding protein LysM [Candidatus Thiodiazotropha sp. (ex Codakia orbicularis)]MBV2104487.1 peptidoglycan-binding protein LysM [Candidatus Thiodiazotropha sp. (ex Lucina aurantia)]MBT3024279.1 peptidoglyc
MGLFDFAANLGKKLFGKDDDPAEKIKQQIEADNPGIKDLDVSFDDGKVVLSGNADSAEALEKTVLIAGNVQGVSEVTADAVTAPQQQAKVEYYTIESGDTLSAIAKRFLGKASDYPKIFEANREVIKDPNLIYPGQKIRIPLD